MKPNDKAIEAALLAAKTVLRNNEITVDSAIFAAVNAAFAAQFPPSEDYAGLIKELRDASHCHQCVASGEKAADALEAALAERDRLNGVIQSYQILLETQQSMLVDTQTERDALLARLAPVEDGALVEIVAKRMCVNDDDFNDEEFVWSYTAKSTKEYYLRQARVAIAAVRPLIEAAERERIADTVKNWGDDPHFQLLAAAIRRGK